MLRNAKQCIFSQIWPLLNIAHPNKKALGCLSKLLRYTFGPAWLILFDLLTVASLQKSTFLDWHDQSWNLAMVAVGLHDVRWEAMIEYCHGSSHNTYNNYNTLELLILKVVPDVPGLAARRFCKDFVTSCTSCSLHDKCRVNRKHFLWLLLLCSLSIMTQLAGFEKETRRKKKRRKQGGVQNRRRL